MAGHRPPRWRAELGLVACGHHRARRWWLPYVLSVEEGATTAGCCKQKAAAQDQEAEVGMHYVGNYSSSGLGQDGHYLPPGTAPEQVYQPPTVPGAPPPAVAKPKPLLERIFGPKQPAFPQQPGYPQQQPLFPVQQQPLLPPWAWAVIAIAGVGGLALFLGGRRRRPVSANRRRRSRRRRR